MNWIGTVPWVTVLAAAMEAAMAGTIGILFVPCLLSVFRLSGLRGVFSCGSRRGPRSSFGLFVFSVCFPDLKNKNFNRKAKMNSAGLRALGPLFLHFGQPQRVCSPISSSFLFSAVVLSFLFFGSKLFLQTGIVAYWSYRYFMISRRVGLADV